MKPDQQERNESMKALRAAQAKHARLLKKVRKSRAHFEQFRSELQAIEAEITSLTRRTYEPFTREASEALDSAELRRARLIFDAGAEGKDGRMKQLKEIVKCIRAHGLIAEVDLKLSDETLQDMVRETIESEEELLIVVGADDTLEQVAPQLAGSNIALGFIPLGAQTQHAAALGIPLDVSAACALLGTGSARRIALARLVEGAAGELNIIAPPLPDA